MDLLKEIKRNRLPEEVVTLLDTLEDETLYNYFGDDIYVIGGQPKIRFFRINTKDETITTSWGDLSYVIVVTEKIWDIMRDVMFNSRYKNYRLVWI